MEKTVIETVESGTMTKDLAINIYGNKVDNSKYVDTVKFIEIVAKNLDKKLWWLISNINYFINIIFSRIWRNNFNNNFL